VSRDVHCFIFGHTPSYAKLEAAIWHDGFVCRRCGEAVEWSGRLLAEVTRARAVLTKAGRAPPAERSPSVGATKRRELPSTDEPNPPSNRGGVT
jgi:hypothetical protein